MNYFHYSNRSPSVRLFTIKHFLLILFSLALTSCVSSKDIATIQKYSDRGLCGNWASIPSSHRLNRHYEVEIRSRRLSCFVVISD